MGARQANLVLFLSRPIPSLCFVFESVLVGPEFIYIYTRSINTSPLPSPIPGSVNLRAPGTTMTLHW